MALDTFVPDLVRRIGDLYDPGGAHAAMQRGGADAARQARRDPRADRGRAGDERLPPRARRAERRHDHGRSRAVDESDALLVIADDGPGLREPDKTRKHFGFTIVAGLAKGLGGSFEHESRGGLITRVRFPAGDLPESD